MAAQYILIDYENIQPKNLDILAKHAFNVLVFFGMNQTKVSRGFLKSMLLLRSQAEVVEMSGSEVPSLACCVGDQMWPPRKMREICVNELCVVMHSDEI